MCINEAQPFCEPHLVYDLLRAYRRRGFNDVESAEQLEAALLLLVKSYVNVRTLLIERFDPVHVKQEAVQQMIANVLEKTKTSS